MTTTVAGSTHAHPRARMWAALQLTGLLATAALLMGLATWPKPTLAVLWNIVVPVLPASFLLAPALWRNVCPLASLNTLANGFISRRRLQGNVVPFACAVGIGLLIVLVPARRFLFNLNGPALAVVIVAVALLALTMGAIFDVKAGFCNAICPVLPVERLYGQQPLLAVENPRCTDCTLCAPRGCMDLSPTKSIAQTLGPVRRSNAWLASPYGAFAAAFPGFIIGYYTVSDGPLGQAAFVYAHIAAWMAGSWIVAASLVTALRIEARIAAAGLAAVAVALYYWFAAPVVARTLGTPATGTIVIRLVAAALIATWLSSRRELRAAARAAS